MWFFRFLDTVRLPRVLETVWHLLTSVSRLSEAEASVAYLVLGDSAIRYAAVRVAEGRLLKLIFKFNGGRAFTTFHTINLPRSSGHSREHLDIVVHELIHVCQYEVCGSQYIWQALRAQRTAGYEYGGWQQLVDDRGNGRHYCDYNREQQGQIAQDYYNDVVVKGLPTEAPQRQAYEPFIDELRSRKL